MRGLLSLPKKSELAFAYRELESSRLLTEIEIAKYSQWARIDPRLAELLTGYLGRFWSEIKIFPFLQTLTSEPWPRAVLVPLRFCEIALESEARFERTALRALIDAIESAFPTPSNDLYFIPLQRLSSVITEETLKFPTEPYLRSGFLGSASLLAKGRVPPDETLMPQVSRQRLLEEIIRGLPRGETITIKEYMTRCKGLVSRRQAQRDLEAAVGLVASGFTRGRRYKRA